MKINEDITFMYVPHEKVEQFKRLGWVFECKMMGHHGKYAVIMKKIKKDKKMK